MSNSKLVNYTKLSPNCNKPRKYPITKITIHHMAGNLSVERCGEVFASASRQASSNYGIDSNGRVGLYVDEANRSWCSSNADNDNRAVTIEVANDEIGGDWHVSNTALRKLIDLCVDICERNHIESLDYTGNKSGNLTEHNYFAATSCPGPYLKSKLPYIAEEVNKRLAGVNKPVNSVNNIIYQTWDDVKNKWLPNVWNDSDYAGIFKHDVCCIYANLDIGNVYYKVHVKGGVWLPEVKNREDYAGIKNEPIDGFMIKGSRPLTYRVHLRRQNRWLPWVTGYNTNDHDNGYAGIIGQEIDAIQIK